MVVLLLFLLQWATASRDRPIIGVLSEPSVDTNPRNAEISASYVKWLESGGSRVALIPFDAPTDVLRELFQSVNGLLFTGGDNTLDADTRYYKTGKTLFKWAKEENLNGNFFPVWGTCQGFQLMSILVAEDHSVLLKNEYDSWNIDLPIVLTAHALKSRLLGSAPQSVIDAFTKENSTQNLHHNGVLPITFHTNRRLSEMFHLLSVNEDLRGKPFGSTMEAKKFPFYATQWHPERNQFEWGGRQNILKTSGAIEAMQYLVKFFVDEARKNTNVFRSVAAETKALIYNYKPTYTGDDPSDTPDQQTYYFPLNQEL